VLLKIARDVRAYHRARESLSHLEATQDILQKYQLIKAEELGVSKDVTEENQYGQSSNILPWFWRIGGSQLRSPGVLNEECKCFNFEFFLNIHISVLKFTELAG
jgi:hypothetical protein